MSRKFNCRNKSDEWPYLCRWHQADAIRSHTVVDPQTECWRWTGWLRSGRPAIFLKGNKKVKHIIAQANHLAWWMKHGERIERPYLLKQTCSTKDCVNPDHREQTSYKRMRVWSMREVKHWREQYWGTETAEGQRHKYQWMTSPTHLTAIAFGVDIECIRRFLKGRKCRFTRWPNPKVTAGDVLKELAKNKQVAARNKSRARNALTIVKIARASGCKMMAVSDMLKGHTYKSAGGPTGPVRQVAHKLKVA